MQMVPPNDALIRARAYQYWLDEGCPDGRHEIHWQWAVESLASRPPPTPVVEPAAADTAAAPAAPAAPAAAPVATSAAAPSDVSLISGIGPRFKALLAAEGIGSLAQVAALTPPALEALDAKMGLNGRSLRDEWVLQARELLAGKPPRAKTDKQRAKPAGA